MTTDPGDVQVYISIHYMKNVFNTYILPIRTYGIETITITVKSVSRYKNQIPKKIMFTEEKLKYQNKIKEVFLHNLVSGNFLK